jgi:hypothetical protein
MPNWVANDVEKRAEKAQEAWGESGRLNVDVSASSARALTHSLPPYCLA